MQLSWNKTFKVQVKRRSLMRSVYFFSTQVIRRLILDLYFYQLSKMISDSMLKQTCGLIEITKGNNERATNGSRKEVIELPGKMAILHTNRRNCNSN